VDGPGNIGTPAVALHGKAVRGVVDHLLPGRAKTVFLKRKMAPLPAVVIHFSAQGAAQNRPPLRKSEWKSVGPTSNAPEVGEKQIAQVQAFPRLAAPFNVHVRVEARPPATARSARVGFMQFAPSALAHVPGRRRTSVPGRAQPETLRGTAPGSIWERRQLWPSSGAGSFAPTNSSDRPFD